MDQKQKKERICKDLRLMETEDYQIDVEHIKAVFVSEPKNKKENEGVITVKFHNQYRGLNYHYLAVLKSKHSNADLPFEDIIEYKTRPEIIEKRHLSKIIDEKPEESANMIRMFGFAKDHRNWTELTERDRAQRIEEIAQSRKRSTRKGQKLRDNHSQEETIKPEKNTKGPKHQKRRSSQQKLQFESIAETVTNKLNTHQQTEEYVKNSLFDIFKHAAKYRKGIKFISLRDWTVKNICHNAKRIIILMHLGKQRGYEWNAHDININVLWQRQWEGSLELMDDDMSEVIKTSESFTEALKRLQHIMNANTDKCILLQSEDIIAEAFAATQISAPTIASIVSAKYEEISRNEDFRPCNFPKEVLTGTCSELDTVISMEGWEKQEYTRLSQK